ncbi:TDP-N-acetylfucosamine:lipid II N-acetylfucosaminyltransferase [Shewanella sp. HL-SH2]|uniref:TDP-N-acetylfucosamine:lipid II N-acetylfucosaminyltransferase n=1 Tax=Shewanella sp. HL-SH2 TaxID=3436238 RepID=UPI003EB95169
MSNKTLHIAYLDKFIPGFIEILKDNFSDESHTFITFGDIDKYPYQQTSNTTHYPTIKSFMVLTRLAFTCHTHNKIILHGLFMHQLTLLLCFMPWLHKKCLWVIWGGDLYYHKLAIKNTRYHFFEIFRRFLISRLGGFITYVDGDYRKAQNWYGAKGVLYESITYKSNIFSGGDLCETVINQTAKNEAVKVNLLVGNSADQSNNHKQIFEQLVKLDIENGVDKIFCPLSYGNSDYAERIKNLGELMFGDKFYPLMDFMPLEQYNKILDVIDIGIFAHNRQQAMGSTINLLGRGKTVFMRTDTSAYALLTKLKIKVYALDYLSLIPQTDEVSIANNKNVRNYFSELNLVKQLKNIFG